MTVQRSPKNDYQCLGYLSADAVEAFCFATNQLDGNGLSTAKRFLIGSVIAGLLWMFIPNEKEAAAMYVLPKLVNNEAAQNLPKDLASLVHDWAEELSTRTKKKGDRE